MKKLIGILAIATVFFTTSASAGVMPVLLNCEFEVKDDVLRVSVFNHPEWDKEFHLNKFQVTIVEGLDGNFAASIHKKGTKYWEVPEMYEISLKAAARMAIIKGVRVVRPDEDCSSPRT